MHIFLCFSLAPPTITTAPAREVQVITSSSSVQNYTMKCNASGDPYPNITWTKDGVPASQFNASGYLLHLVDVQRDDAGSYICTASNGYGEDATAIGIVNIRCMYTKHRFSYKSLITSPQTPHTVGEVPVWSKVLCEQAVF